MKKILISLIIISIFCSFIGVCTNYTKYDLKKEKIEYIELDGGYVEVIQGATMTAAELFISLLKVVLKILVEIVATNGPYLDFSEYNPSDNSKAIYAGTPISMYISTVGEVNIHFKLYKVVGGNPTYYSNTCYEVADDQTFTINTAKDAGNTISMGVQFYTDSSCNTKKGDLKKSNSYKISESGGNNESLSVESITERIGGVGHYCNLNGSVRNSCASAGINNLFACVAYSQIGYKEKASSDNINACTTNSGGNNYQKYGNSGSKWCDSFVKWVATKSGVTVLNNLGDTASIEKWAIGKGIFWYPNSDYVPHAGDLVIYNGHIAIYDGSKVIHGNWGDKVSRNDKDLNEKTLEGYVSMSGYTY